MVINTLKRTFLFSSVKKKEDFNSSKFYKDDFNILEFIGHQVFFSNKISDFFSYQKYENVLIYFYTKGVFVAFISKLFGKKVVFTGGIDYVDETNLFKLSNLLFVLCYFLCDTIFIVSKSDFNKVKAILNSLYINDSKLIYNPHYINFSEVESVIDNSDFLKSNNISDSDILFTTICWRGEIENVYRKGLDTCLKVFKCLVDNNSRNKLLIIGDGGKGDDIVFDLISKLHLENNVVITGRIDHMTKFFLLSKSKYYLQFSRYEGFGLAVLEAIISKCLIVHSNRGGLNETISDRGLIINIDDSPDFIADKITNFIFDDSYLDVASKFVLREYSFNKRASLFNKYF